MLTIGMVVSCSVRKPIPPVVIENTKEITKTIRDTIYKVEADNSYYEAYIDCINGKPVIRETTKTQNKSKPGVILEIPKVNINNGLLQVDCNKKAQELLKQWQEVYIKEHEQKTIYLDNPVYVDNPLAWYQTVQIWLGRIFLFITAIVGLAFILRWKKVI
ncbi:hypothetical protein DBR39_13740 [Chryseobacterium sp. KBW03]|nr:hypothetical protein DBR39_13740 [Chryseobacterium sp. KBW03]